MLIYSVVIKRSPFFPGFCLGYLWILFLVACHYDAYLLFLNWMFKLAFVVWQSASPFLFSPYLLVKTTCSSSYDSPVPSHFFEDFLLNRGYEKKPKFEVLIPLWWYFSFWLTGNQKRIYKVYIHVEVKMYVCPYLYTHIQCLHSTSNLSI